MPMDRSLYPPDWREISRRAVERAGDRCEECGVRNRAVVVRNGDAWRYANHNEMLGGVEEPERLVRIVLTVHHKVAVAEGGSHDDANLVALCQRCHNRADAPMRARHAAATRRSARVARGQATLVPG